MKNHIFLKSFCLWLPFAALATLMCGLAYLLVQQDIRLSANYPQSVIARDVTSATFAIPAPTSTSSPVSNLVDISKSSALFLSTFDINGKLVQSNAVLDGATPVPPLGVFGYAQAHGEDRFTWQPETGVRMAAVLVYHPMNMNGQDSANSSGFFALSGRSLNDVETIESKLTTDTFIVWIITLVVTYVLSIFTGNVFTKSSQKKNLDEVTEVAEEEKEKVIEKPIREPIQIQIQKQNVVVMPKVSPPPPPFRSPFSLKNPSTPPNPPNSPKP